MLMMCSTMTVAIQNKKLNRKDVKNPVAVTLFRRPESKTVLSIRVYPLTTPYQITCLRARQFLQRRKKTCPKATRPCHSSPVVENSDIWQWSPIQVGWKCWDRTPQAQLWRRLCDVELGSDPLSQRQSPASACLVLAVHAAQNLTA